MKKYGIWAVLCLIILVGIGITYASSRNKQQRDSKDIKIGVLVPLTGTFASYGEDIRNSVELAKRELKEETGANIEIIYEDSGADPKKAVSAVNKLIEANKVPVIIGGPGSSANLAVTPITEQRRTVFVAISSTSKLNDAGEYVFKAHPDFDGEINRMANYIYKQGLRRVGIIYDSTSDTQTGGKDVFTRQFGELGGTVVAAEGSDNSTTDFRSQLLKLKEANADALYFLVIEKVAGQVVRQTRESGLSQPIFGTTAYETEGFLKTAGLASENVVITAQPFSCAGTDMMVRYCENYQKSYSSQPTQYGVHAYDLVKLIVERNRNKPFTAEDIRQSLIGARYQGVSGDLNFDQQGNVRDKDFVFRTVKGGKFVKLEQ